MKFGNGLSPAVEGTAAAEGCPAVAGSVASGAVGSGGGGVRCCRRGPRQRLPGHRWTSGPLRRSHRPVQGRQGITIHQAHRHQTTKTVSCLGSSGNFHSYIWDLALREVSRGVALLPPPPPARRITVVARRRRGRRRVQVDRRRCWSSSSSSGRPARWKWASSDMYSMYFSRNPTQSFICSSAVPNFVSNVQLNQPPQCRAVRRPYLFLVDLSVDVE